MMVGLFMSKPSIELDYVVIEEIETGYTGIYLSDVSIEGNPLDMDNNYNITSIYLYFSNFINNTANFLVNPNRNGIDAVLASQGLYLESNTVRNSTINLGYIIFQMQPQ